MSLELLTIALIAGLANWMFRALPVILRTDRMVLGAWVERFLSGTGPAAIATLFVAAVLPMLSLNLYELLPVVIGTAAVLVAYVATRSVVVATLGGAFAYGAIVWLTS